MNVTAGSRDIFNNTLLDTKKKKKQEHYTHFRVITCTSLVPSIRMGSEVNQIFTEFTIRIADGVLLYTVSESAELLLRVFLLTFCSPSEQTQTRILIYVPDYV